MDRLETLAPELVQRLSQASPAKQRAAAIAASEFAIEKAHIQHAAVDEACESLRTAGGISAAQQAEVEALMSILDNEYFDLQEAAEEGRATTEDYLRKFAQARAVSALLFAAKDDPFEASTEAVYEAAAAFDDKRPLFLVIESVL
ncbi:MAG: hypothetical protein WD063_08095 [Pirellulales bacterium]